MKVERRTFDFHGESEFPKVGKQQRGVFRNSENEAGEFHPGFHSGFVRTFLRMLIGQGVGPPELIPRRESGSFVALATRIPRSAKRTPFVRNPGGAQRLWTARSERDEATALRSGGYERLPNWQIRSDCHLSVIISRQMVIYV
jgi:hypothetical protein